jgi:hypothetical protein
MMWGAVTALDKGPTVDSQPVVLSVEVDGVEKPFSSTLAQGVRGLYEAAEFCDVNLLACGQSFPAHKAVLAATSTAFRERVQQAVSVCEIAAAPLENVNPAALEGPASTETVEKGEVLPPASTDPSGDAADVVAPSETSPGEQDVPIAPQRQIPEIQFPSVSCPEAIRILLAHVYGVDEGEVSKYQPSCDEANKDVLRLATQLQLPSLKEFATHWLAKELTATNAVLRLSIAQEFALHDFFEVTTEALASDPFALEQVTEDIKIINHPGILQTLLVRIASSRNAPRTSKRGTGVAAEQRPNKRGRAAPQEGGA